MNRKRTAWAFFHESVIDRFSENGLGFCFAGANELVCEVCINFAHLLGVLRGLQYVRPKGFQCDKLDWGVKDEYVGVPEVGALYLIGGVGRF